ncbi:hypothetical protein DRN34_03035 [Thermococci archaeon]|nr:MAG: hypothetical protein DRN34_03035 [Thermococci archaeon]
MLKIIALAKIAPANRRRMFFTCKGCGKKNWFSYGVPTMCQNVYCGCEFYNVEGLLEKKEATMMHYYEKGIV